MTTEELKDRMLGCLYGQAIGNANPLTDIQKEGCNATFCGAAYFVSWRCFSAIRCGRRRIGG